MELPSKLIARGESKTGGDLCESEVNDQAARPPLHVVPDEHLKCSEPLSYGRLRQWGVAGGEERGCAV